MECTESRERIECAASEEKILLMQNRKMYTYRLSDRYTVFLDHEDIAFARSYLRVVM